MTTIVTGHYGSGKTEFCVNLAMAKASRHPVLDAESPKLLHVSEGVPDQAPDDVVGIADLDVINPFFRSRELEEKLKPLGIDIMGSALGNHITQDVPAISFAFLSKIRAGQNIILDLAGGENGLKLLASCYADIRDYNFFCVLNMYRPETNSPGKMIDFCKKINRFSRLEITGLVNNGNLLGQTEPVHVLESQKAVQEVASELNLPIAYTMVQENIYSCIVDKIVSEKVLTFKTPQMRKNWQG